MLIEKDRSNQPIAPPLVLAHKSGEKIGVLLPDPSTLTIKIFLEDSYILSSEMSCDINKYVNTFTNTLWNEIKNFKLLYIPIDIPNFKPKGIWYEIEVTIDDYDNTVKHITGTMAQHAELSQVNNYEVEIRTEDDIDRDDYIDTIFYNPDEPKASIVHRVLNDKAKHYSIYHVDDSLKNIKRTFEFNGESVLSNLHSIAEEVDCIIIFGESEQADNNMHRTVSFYDAKDYCPECGKRGDFSNGCTTPNCTHSQKIIPRYGKDSGIYINKENLGENINLSVNTDEIKNCFRLSAGDDDMLTAIIDCNPAGSRYIWYFTDEMKENMSDALRQRLDTYQAQSDDVRYNYLLSNLTESRIINYNAIVDKYQNYSKEELNKINRNDKGYDALIGAYYGALYLEGFLRTTMMPYSPEVVDTTANEQINLYTLTTLGVRNLVAISNTFAANEVRDSVKIYIDTSRYKVDVKTTNYNKTTNTWTGTITVTSLTDEEDIATVQKTLSFTDQKSDYLKNQIDQLLKKRETGLYGITNLVKANNNTFATEIKKYCLDSLSIISDVLTAVISIMDSAEITPSTSPDVYNEIYVSYQSKIPIINQEMADRENDINRVGYVIEEIQNHKQQMKELLNIETFLGETLWNELLAIRREDEQEDNNFISDGLTDLEIIANAQEFYDTAIQKITKQAESQLTASCTLKDLLLICPEVYNNKIKLFDIGNWMRIDIDEKIYKLRLVSYQFNYGDLTRIQVEFSDCKPSNNIISQFQITRNQTKNNQKGIADISKQVDQNIIDINTILQPFYIQESLVLPVTSIVTETGETLDEYLKNEHIDNVVEIEEAKKVAVNYMSQDDSGIMIAPLLSNYKYLPSEVPLGIVNTFIDNESFNVRVGLIPIARFSANELWLGNNQNFSVTADGYLTATNVDISGTIFANTFSTANGEITYDGTNLNIDASALTVQGTSVATTNALQTAIDDLNDSLTNQLDGKIDTWAQATDPEDDWEEEEYSLHDGDLWYYTGTTKIIKEGVTIMPSKTYKYDASTEKWILYKSPTTSLFDFADSKASVYYGVYPFSDIVDMNENDIAVDSDTEKIYRYDGITWSEIQNYNDAIDDLKDSLIGQLDSKIETWVQDTNPANAWSSSEQVNHDDDLWLYTGTSDMTVGSITVHPQGVYQYNASTNSWTIYSSGSSNIFDMIDGKTTIYYGRYFSGYSGSYYQGTSSPSSAVSSPSSYDMYYNNSTTTTYIYRNGNWNIYTNSDGGYYLDTRYNYVYEWKEFSSFSRWNRVTPVSSGDFFYSTNELSLWKYNGSSFGHYYDIENGDYLVDGTSGCTYCWENSGWNLMTDYMSAINSEVEKYMRFESAYGLMIANMVNGEQSILSATSYNVLLGSTSLKIRNGTSVLAEYGSSIKLYQPGTSTVAVEISPTLAKFTGSIIATGGTIGGFNITSTSNTSNTSSGGHFATNSLYVHSSGGSYEYEAGLKGASGSGSAAFYVARISSGDNWSSGDYMFYIANNGYLFASNANITGAIKATSFTVSGTSFNSVTTITDDIVIKNSNITWADNSNDSKIIFKDNSGTVATYAPFKITLGRDGIINYYDGGFHINHGVYAPTFVIQQNASYYTTSGTAYVGLVRHASDGVYFGIDASNASLHIPKTFLYGGVVRIYAHSGGAVYVGASGSEAVTSDETLKDLYTIDDRYIDFFNKLNPITYIYKVGHRKHLGFGAQSVEKALLDSGLSTEEFAGVIIDENVDIGNDEYISPDNKSHFDKLYSLRYEEFIALNTMMIQKLQKEIQSLQYEIKSLKNAFLY